MSTMLHLSHNQKNPPPDGELRSISLVNGFVSYKQQEAEVKYSSFIRRTLLAVVAIVAIVVSSCFREDIAGPDGFDGTLEPEGLTRISLKVGVPEMDIATRADMVSGEDSKLNSLWVGIFSARTGVCTFAGFVGTGTGGVVDLTSDMFHTWNGVGANATVTNANPAMENNIGKTLNAGGLIFGTAGGSVPGSNYADVTGYSEIRFEGTPGMSVRVLLNRQNMNDGANNDEDLSVQLGADGRGVIDISNLRQPFAHINTIKVPWDGSANVTVTSVKLYKKTNGVSLSQEHGDGTGYVTLNDITVASGESYIVAVGNPAGNYGLQYGASGGVRSSILTELLPASMEAANSSGFVWESYKNIVYHRQSLDNVTDVPTGNLPMSGIYYESLGTHPEPTPAGWEEANEESVRIPMVSDGEIVELPGAIHLRRLISQVKFNVRAADYTGADGNKNGKRIVKVVLESYRIVNAPYSSWLHERRSPADNANSGDIVMLPAVGYNDAKLPRKSNYRASATYRGNQYITGSESEGYKFDFWMLENKRRALSESPIGYDDREKEIKRDDGLNQETVNNTGIYTALCGDVGSETMNNMAAFVELRCKIEYTPEGIGSLEGTAEYGDVKNRTADAVYTVHLGGIGNDWNDFTHRRNHKYTYNVTVMDVDRIIVEAKGEEENRPGIEGVVNDVTLPTFVLDAHYSVFNIQLSNKERTGGSASPYTNGFPFRIQVYDRYGNPIIIDQNNYKEFSSTSGNIPGNDATVKPEYYWTWVEFRPTTGENVLAEYKPYHKRNANGDFIYESGYDYGDNRTFRLNDIADIARYPGNGANADNPDDETPRWYTVFVNEYTYETTTDETANRWVLYANRPDRICWLNSLNDISADKESAYIRSKYTLIQKSIQTFYNISNIDVSNVELDAVGLEHINETYGFTLRWANRWSNVWNGNAGGLSLDNGKRNTRDYLTYDGGQNIYWNRYVTQTTLQKITNINRNAFQFSDPRVTGLPTEGIYYVPASVTYSYYPNFSGGWWSVDSRRYVPNTSQAVQAIEACMNRNRDNNGNGIIDSEEVRWYLPSSSEMVDLVNGSHSLETPLMDYPSTPILISPPMVNSTDNTHHVNTRYHYATSNHRLLWAEEGITINPTVDDETQWNRMGWQVRCARALGTNLQTETNLSSAFTVDNDEAPTRVYPTYFDGKSLRDPVQGALPPHSETSPLNRISTTGFEFKKELIRDNSYKYTNDQALQNPANHSDYITAGNRICADRFGEGWRMPNIKECSVLKVALNQAGLNYDYAGGRNNSNTVVCQVKGYDIGNYFSCTYREYGVNNSPNFQRAETDPTGYYLGIVYDNSDMSGVGNEAERKLGRAQCLTQDAPTYYIRCVRDLQ